MVVWPCIFSYFVSYSLVERVLSDMWRADSDIIVARSYDRSIPRINFGLSLITFASSLYLNSILLFAGFFGFFSAFLVSMFQTDAHNALIVVSGIFVLYECYPNTNSRYAWHLHWWISCVFGVVCAGWILYSVYGCNPVNYDGQSPLPDSVRCARCSYWYITEYVFFWSMYGLVYWRIPAGLVWRDRVPIIEGARHTAGKSQLDPLYRRNPALNF